MDLTGIPHIRSKPVGREKPKERRGGAPPTGRQVRYLAALAAKAGIDPPTVETASEADAAIQDLKARTEPATEKLTKAEFEALPAEAMRAAYEREKHLYLDWQRADREEALRRKECSARERAA